MLTIAQAETQRHHTAPWPTSCSPWGHIDSATHFADGLLLVSTPSHGGFHLSAERLATMPKALRKRQTNYCPADWFEEDCEAALVVMAFPDVFTLDEYQHAVASVEHFYPAQYAEWVASQPGHHEDSVDRAERALHVE